MGMILKRIENSAQAHAYRLESEIYRYMQAQKITKAEALSRMNKCCIHGVLFPQEKKVVCQNFKKKETLPENRIVSMEFCEKCLREQENNECLQWQQRLQEKNLVLDSECIMENL